MTLSTAQRELKAKIAELEATLQSGITATTVAGTTTSIDLDVVRRQLAELRHQDTTQVDRKPRIATILTGGLF